MYQKLLEVLLSSSLGSMISSHEIEEIAIELEDEMQTIISEKVEEKKEELEEINFSPLSKKLRETEDELEKTKKFFPKMDSLSDIMTMEWVIENWESIVFMQRTNVSAKFLLGVFKESVGNFEKMMNLCKEGKQLLTDAQKQFKDRRIVLVGKAASGKDYARKLFTDRNFKHAISYTTRPARVGEIDGVDYYFITEEKFKEMIAKDEFYEYVSFNNWFYGTSKKQFHTDDIFIMTPYGISKIKPEDRKNTLIMFFDIPYDIRRKRLMERSDADSVDRRLLADDQDFKDFKDYDIRITDPEF